MGFAEAERDERVARNLELVNLTGFERKFPWQLSGGMQQRASIARALAFDADLLLMDEPFGALDEIVRDHLNEQLLQLWAQTDKTVVFVTHSIPEAVFLSTRIVVMSPRPGPRHRRDRLDAAARAHARHPRDAGVPRRSPTASARACAPGTAMRTEAAPLRIPRAGGSARRGMRVRRAKIARRSSFARRTASASDRRGRRCAVQRRVCAASAGVVGASCSRFVAVIVVVVASSRSGTSARLAERAVPARPRRAPDVDAHVGEFVAATLSQQKPMLPAPHQVAAELYKTTVARRRPRKRSLVYHGWVTLSSTLARLRARHAARHPARRR